MAAWVEGRWGRIWVEDQVQDVWVEGAWVHTWIDEHYEQQWVDGYYDTVWVDGGWTEQWVDGHSEDQWVDGRWEDHWVDGYEQENWVDGHWEEYSVDGYTDEDGNWVDGYTDYSWVDGHMETSWVDGHSESSWVDGYNESVWIDGHSEWTWVDGYWDYPYVEGHYSDVWVDGYYHSEWVDGHVETATIPAHWEDVWIPGYWDPPLDQTWAAFDEIDGDWYLTADWSPTTGSVPAGQAFVQTRTFTRDHLAGERNDAGEERNVARIYETTDEHRDATGTGGGGGGPVGGGGVKINQPLVSSAGAQVAVGAPFTPTISGGAGTGAKQAVWGGYTNWGDSHTFTPAAEGEYFFWVRQLGDSQYHESNIAGPYRLYAGPILSAPVVSSGATTANHGVGFSYSIIASHQPVTYGAAGLPNGLSLHATTGEITGVPTQAGTFSVALSASNSVGTGHGTLTLTVQVGSGTALPIITSPSSATASYGADFEYQITTQNGASTYGASGLPAGLTVNPASGLITGAPLTTGLVTFTVTATSGVGPSTASVGLDIAKAAPRGSFDDVLVETTGLLQITWGMLNATFAHETNSGAAPATGSITYSAVRASNPNQTYNPLTPESITPGMTVYYGRLLVTATYHGDAFYAPASVTATFQNIDTQPPAPPANLRVALVGPTAFSVNWDGVTDIPSSEVDAKPPYEVTLHGGTPLLEKYPAHRFNGLQPGGTYNASVRMRDWSGNWSEPATLPTPITLPAAGPLESEAPRWADVDGDGLRDEIIGGATELFNYIIAETSTQTVTHESWTWDFVAIPWISYNDGFSIFVTGWYIPDYDIYTETINTVRPLFQAMTQPGYQYFVCRPVTNPQNVTSYMRLKGLSFLNGIEEWMPAGYWPELAFHAFPTVLSRISLPPAGVQLNLPILGAVSINAGPNGISGSMTLPGGLKVDASNSSATISLPGAGAVTVSGGNVSGSINLPGGYVLSGVVGGNVTLSGLPGGTSITTGPGGTTLSIPNGPSVQVAGNGKISVSLPPGSPTSLSDAVDAVGRLLGISGVLKAQVLPPGGQPGLIWHPPGSIDLGSQPHGVIQDVVVTSDENPNPTTRPQNIVRFTVVVQQPPTMATLMWEAIDSPLSANPNAGGGQRIFPGKTTPTDTTNRQRVKLKAKISPEAAGVTVHFKVFDVDDPSAMSLPLDDETKLTDNRFAWSQLSTSATTNAQGFAEVVVEVGVQPGDNYRAVASTGAANAFDGFVAKQNDGALARIVRADGSAVAASSTLQVSELLTVWRKLHIEVDSMGVVTGNDVAADVTDVSNAIFGRSRTLTTNFILNDSVNRFKGGTFHQGGFIWPVPSNTAGANFKVTIDRAAADTPEAVLGPFPRLADDDMTGEVPDPPTGQIAVAFMPAYVEPEFDGGGALANNNSSVTFVANIEASNTDASQLTAVINANRQSPAITNEYWSIYVLGAFQGGRADDFDPNDTAVESQLGGVNPRTATRGLGAIVYLETCRDCSFNSSWVTAHEIGHYFSPGHETDGSLMSAGHAVVRGTFNDETLSRIRSWRM